MSRQSIAAATGPRATPLRTLRLLAYGAPTNTLSRRSLANRAENLAVELQSLVAALRVAPPAAAAAKEQHTARLALEAAAVRDELAAFGVTL